MKKCVSKLKIFCNKTEDQSDSVPVLLKIEPAPTDSQDGLQASDVRKPRYVVF